MASHPPASVRSCTRAPRIPSLRAMCTGRDTSKDCLCAEGSQELGTWERPRLTRASGHLTWAELESKVLCYPAPLSTTLVAVPLMCHRVVLE